MSSVVVFLVIAAAFVSILAALLFISSVVFINQQRYHQEYLDFDFEE
jgi:hypothetical protein